MTGDLGFANVLRFVPGTHAGMVVARFPNEVANEVVNAAILEAVRGVTEEELRGALLIVEPGRIRLRMG